MEITDDLLKRFFANDCTAEEGALVYEYLKNNPKKADEWLAPYWNEADGTGKLPAGYKEEMLGKIKMAIAGDRQSSAKKYIKFLAAAASLLLLIAATWWLAGDKPVERSN